MSYTLFEVPEGLTLYEIDSSYNVISGSSTSMYAFRNSHDTLEAFSFSDDNPELEEIQPYAFYSCSKLKSIDLSKCSFLRTIGASAFQLCNSVETLLLPEGVLSLGDSCFQQLSALSSVILPKSLQTIGMYLFHRCSSLKTVEFKKGVQITYLPDWVIRSTGVQVFEIPKNVVSIALRAFEFSYSLVNISVEDGNNNFQTYEGVLYSNSFSTLLVFPSNHSTYYSIVDGCREIGTASFSGPSIHTLSIPSTVMTIGQSAFYDSELRSIEIPSYVTTIYSFTFQYCNSLTDVKLSEEITIIQSYAFNDCNLTTLSLPSKVSSIGEFCFAKNENLILVILPSGLNKLSGGVFNDCHPNITITFLNGSKFQIINQFFIVDKQNTTIYQYLGSQNTVALLSSFTTIDSGAFSNNEFLVNVIIEENSNLKEVGKSAFSGCTKLESFPFEKLEIIQDSAFSSCNSLTNVSFGSSLQSIGSQAFMSCSHLSSVKFSPTTESLSIKSDAFRSNEELENVSFENGLISVGNHAFYSCNKLTKIIFPSTLETIGEYALNGRNLKTVTFADDCNIDVLPVGLFSGCTQLDEIKIPEKVTNISSLCFENTGIYSFTVPLKTKSIGQQAFDSCKNLETFIIPQDCELETIGYKIFAGCSSLATIESHVSSFVVENAALYNRNKDTLYAFPPASPIHYFFFSEKVKNVLSGAFIDCINLRIILIPENSIESIGFSAFEGCINLHTINLPNSVKKIEQSAFLGCNKLKCGLDINITDSNLINEWIKTAALPERCVKPCVIPTCQHNTNRFIFSYIKFATIIIGFSQ